jgi:hypothetical protein
MEPFRDDQLIAELHGLRPAPRPAFAAELDARAAAGFPRKASVGGPPLSRLAARLRALPPRGLLLPAGATAIAAIVVATAAVALSEDASTTNISRTISSTSKPASAQGLTGHLAHSQSPHLDSLPATNGAEKPSAEAGHAASSSGAASSHSADSSAIQFSEAVPARVRAPSGPYASQTGHRDVERSAEMVLGADPADVRHAAGKVFETVHRYDGIVLRSSIEDGGEGEAGASFELLIPSGKLSDALAAFSAIAEVRSRHESTADVTAKTVSLGERLQDGRATVESLLKQLANADTDAKRAAAEAELHSERLRVAALRSRLADLRRRANLSHVSLRIETGEGGAAAAGKDGSWGVGDALGDAGHILAIAAGVTLIGLAIIAPLALLCLLGWLAHRAWARRSREHALG